MGTESPEKPDVDRPMGTLACITTGFEVIARNPDLIIFPVLLDLFLWLGPRLSVAPIVEKLRPYMASAKMTSEVTALVSQQLTDMSQRFNLFTALSPAPLLGVPSLMTGLLTLERPFGVRPEIVMGSVLPMIAAVVLLVLLGLSFSALYLRALGSRVVAETEIQLAGPGTWLQTWKQLVSLVFSVGIYLAGAILVVLVVVTLLALFSMPFAVFLLTLALSFILFTVLHLTFAVPAVVQLRHPVLQAVRESFLLTRADFVNASFLLLLIFVISMGLNYAWALPKPSSWATLIGIGGHAFVSSGLTAAVFIFYQERLGFLRTLQQVRATSESPVRPLAGK